MTDLLRVVRDMVASELAWSVVVGIVDSAIHECDGADRASFFEELGELLDAWPARERVCPLHWLGDLFEEEPSARIALVRALVLEGKEWGEGVRTHASWLGALAVAPQIHFIEHIEVRRLFKVSGELTAAFVALGEAASPVMFEFDYWTKEKIRAPILEQLSEQCSAGVTTRVREDVDEVVMRESAAALDEAFVQVCFGRLGDLEEALGRASLSHVRALSIRLRYGASGWTLPVGEGADFGGLLSLELHIEQGRVGREPAPGVYEALAAWLATSRPRHVRVNDPELAVALARCGVFAQARGANLMIPAGMPPGEVTSLLSSEEVMAATIELEKPPVGGDVLSSEEAIEAMHPTLQAHLVGLSWPVSAKEFKRLAKIFTNLPSLSIWFPMHAGAQEDRVTLLKAIALAKPLRKLRLFNPSGMRLTSKKVPLIASEKKILDRGDAFGSQHVITTARYPSFARMSER